LACQAASWLCASCSCARSAEICPSTSRTRRVAESRAALLASVWGGKNVGSGWRGGRDAGWGRVGWHFSGCTGSVGCGKRASRQEELAQGAGMLA